jgi:hypothetical protein
MPGTRPLIFEEPNPEYVAAERRKAIARKASFSYQPGELGPVSSLPPQPSLLKQYKDEL